MNQLSSSSDPAFSSCMNPPLQIRDISQTRSVEDSSTDPHLDTLWAKNTQNLPSTDPLTSPQSSVLLQSFISHSQNERTIFPLLPQISPLRLSSQSPAILRLDNTKPNHPSPSYWQEIIQLIFLNLLFRLPLLYSNRVDRVFPKVRMSKLDFGPAIFRTTPDSAARRRTPRYPSLYRELLGAVSGYNIAFEPSPSLMFTPLELHEHRPHAALLGEHLNYSHSLEWDIFVIELIKEWRAFNILSALLMS